MAELNLEAERALFIERMRDEMNIPDFVTDEMVLAGQATEYRFEGWLAARRAVPAQASAPAVLDPVVEANRALLLERSQVGIKKYGAVLPGALTRRELVRHALEEALDLANYLQADLQLDAQSPSQGEMNAGVKTAILGLGRMTDHDNGIVELQFKDEEAAQDFMQGFSPTVDVRDMPPIHASQQEASADKLAITASDIKALWFRACDDENDGKGLAEDILASAIITTLKGQQ